jgi:drug/metabolite transporter (DMT)-like permease
MPRSVTATAIPLVFVLTLLWGTNWALFPLALAEVSVWTFRAITLVVAGGILLGLAKLRGQSLAVPRGAWGVLVAASFVYLVVWNIATALAAILIPSGQAAILAFTMPAWTALIMWIAFGDRPSPRLFVAVTLSVVGVGLLGYAARGAYASAPLGFAMGLLAAAGWAGGTVILKRAQLQLPPLVSAGWQVLIAAVPTVPIAFALGSGEWFVPSWTSILVIAYIGMVPMAFGNAAWFAIVGLLPANVSGLSSVMVPMVAMVTGAIVHREPLGAYQLAAMACCAAAMALALFKPAAAAKAG